MREVPVLGKPFAAQPLPEAASLPSRVQLMVWAFTHPRHVLDHFAERPSFDDGVLPFAIGAAAYGTLAYLRYRTHAPAQVAATTILPIPEDQYLL